MTQSKRKTRQMVLKSINLSNKEKITLGLILGGSFFFGCLVFFVGAA